MPHRKNHPAVVRTATEAELVQDISAASAEMSGNAEQINRAITQLDQASELQAAHTAPARG